MFAGLLAYDDTARLARITAPSLLIWGDADDLTGGEVQDRLAGELGSSELLVHPGAGHTPRWEDPVRFGADVAAFVERASAR